MLLNTKSIIDCNEEEYEDHIQELTDIEELICELPNYDCAVIIKYLDPAHENREESFPVAVCMILWKWCSIQI